MTFTSFSYFLFLPLVAILWYSLPGQSRKWMLLASSYLFYGWTSPAFALLLLATTLLSYCAAILIERGGERKRVYLTLACLIHFGALFVFKYLNFFFGAFTGGRALLSVGLPVGISFFTFAVTGYLFDVYRGKLSAERALLDYALFVAFFPCLLAGPIGRAREFLPQMKSDPRFDMTTVKTGFLRFLYGLFQKLVIADTVCIAVNLAYSGQLPRGMWFVIVLLYPLEIYFDFAGYSNMAIGSALALGFRVTENFTAPYLSVSVRSFWKKWHISLTSWFREYLYFPLGGSREGKTRTYMNILIVFAVSGLWHGAAVTYLVWGLLNGLLQVFELLLEPKLGPMRDKARQSMIGKAVAALLGAGVTYVLIAVTFVFFRASDVVQALDVLRASLLEASLHPFDLRMTDRQLLVMLVCLGVGTVFDVLKTMGWQPRRLARTVTPYYLAAAALIFAAALFGVYGEGFDMQSFVYFKY